MSDRDVQSGPSDRAIAQAFFARYASTDMTTESGIALQGIFNEAKRIPDPPAGARDAVRQIISETIGFGFESGELQPVSEDDLMRLAAALTGNADGIRDRCTDPDNCRRCSEDAETPHAGISYQATQPAATGMRDDAVAALNSALGAAFADDPANAVRAHAAVLPLISALAAAPVAAGGLGDAPSSSWLDISEVEQSDDLFWFLRRDRGGWIVDGPRTPQANGYDADEWTWFAPCESPPIAALAAAPVAAGGLGDADVLAALQEHVRQIGTQKEFAQHGVHASEQYVSDVLSGRRPIPEKWVAPLGFVKSWVNVGNRAAIEAALAAQPAPVLHPDDAAVDAFASAMKEKLATARAKGRGGWDDTSDPELHQHLSNLLREHVEKGDPRDVANFCMFLHQRSESILPMRDIDGVQPAPVVGGDELREVGELLAVMHGDGGHYCAEHGIAKASRDALEKYNSIRQLLAAHPAKKGDGRLIAAYLNNESVLWQYLRHLESSNPTQGTRPRMCDVRAALAALLSAVSVYAADPLLSARPGGEGFDFAAHLQRQREWSERTFGPGPRTAGVTDHIRKELLEVEAAPTDSTEWIDVVILALDGAWRSGASPSEIIASIVAKQTKNEGRTWPDWRTADPDKAIEHDRSADTVKCDAWSCNVGTVCGPYDNAMTCGKCNGTGHMPAHPSTAGGEDAKDAVDHRFTDMLLAVLNDTQNALGFTDEEKSCSNGSAEIVAAIVELRELAARAVPFLRDEGNKYDDDGSNEPLELAREIDAALSSGAEG